MKYISYKDLRDALGSLEDKKLIKYLDDAYMPQEYCLGFICAVKSIKTIIDDMAMDNTKCIIAAKRNM